MEKQMVAVKKAYLRHSDYGRASMQEILQLFPDARPLALKATHLETSYIENLGNGKFSLHKLPPEAQLAPVYGILAGDLNGDHLPDILLIGNDYGIETGMGRCDALNGLLLAGDGRGNFHPLPMVQSGICIPGDGKSLVQLQAADGGMLIAAGQNRGPLKAYRKNADSKNPIRLRPLDCAAIVQLKDGRTYRQELPYGNGFLSQTARRLWLPQKAVAVEIIDFQGNAYRPALTDRQ